MQTSQTRDEANLEQGSNGPENTLRVVIVYNGPAAGKRAMRVLQSLAQQLNDKIEFRPLPWAFEHVLDVYWSKLAAREAANADILIIATSDARSLPFPLVLGRWIEAAVAGLFGERTNSGESRTSRLEAIQSAARQGGLDFYVPGPANRSRPSVTPSMCAHHQALN